MALVLEANIVSFPEKQPSSSRHKNDPPVEWTAELKRNFFHQEAQIHLLKLGPVDQDVLDTKLVHMDFKGVNFQWNKETKEYRWDSGVNLKPLTHKYIMHLLGELRKVGFEKPNNWYSPDTSSFFNGEKKFWRLEKKF